MRIVVVSGGFDPIHSGHIAYFKAARSHGDKLVIALNSDAWLENKKGKAFMPFDERKIIIENFTFVDEVIDFEDDDLGSCIKGLEKKNFAPSVDVPSWRSSLRCGLVVSSVACSARCSNSHPAGASCAHWLHGLLSSSWASP